MGDAAAALTALRDATQSIPIVFVLVNDPCRLTGFCRRWNSAAVIGKSLGLLRQLAPE
jgi:hypothetical protein